FPASKGALHAFEDGLDGHLRFGLGDARSIDHFIDDIEFDQSRLRKPHDRIGVNPLSSADLYRRACSRFATAVAVLTTRAPDGAPHGLTINAFSSISLDPPVVMVSIAHDCTILEHFGSSRAFAVNILREEQVDLSTRFSELPEGRFTGVPWKPGFTESPVLD